MESKQVEIGKAFGYGWTELKKNFWYFVALAVIVTVIEGLAPGWRGKHVTINILGWFLSAWMTCGFMRILLDYYGGTKRELSDVFTQFQYFWRVFLAMLFIGIITAIGFILLVIPGIYLALRFQFTIPLIIDKNLDVADAMKQSSALTQGIKLPLFGFALSALGIMILGAIALGIGIFVALPIVWLAYLHLYKNIQPNSATVTPSANSGMVR